MGLKYLAVYRAYPSLLCKVTGDNNEEDPLRGGGVNYLILYSLPEKDTQS